MNDNVTDAEALLILLVIGLLVGLLLGALKLLEKCLKRRDQRIIATPEPINVFTIGGIRRLNSDGESRVDQNTTFEVIEIQNYQSNSLPSWTPDNDTLEFDLPPDYHTTTVIDGLPSYEEIISPR
ncbi:uncharacterized protein LOC132197345 [Neocloeon triangulifer]|uniref:uncharacterized protein LOC132197345 n=1 Tax=Neocloeon triangulifer TaxID=2078957 RepID=UPI00286F66DE|nr:uncharacterized protein LOC132197345 [Neocloeon triangulifer]